MATQSAQDSVGTRITLAALRELERYSRLFRRRLRDAALELVERSGTEKRVTEESVDRALRVACEELLALAASRPASRAEPQAERAKAA